MKRVTFSVEINQINIMCTIKLIRNALFPIFMSLILCSCFFDSKPLGYCVKNGTKDTLLIDVTDSDSLNSDMYWDLHSKDTIVLMSEDTTSVYIHGNKVVIYNFYRVLPGTVSRGFWPIYSDSFYVYTIKWNVVRNYTLKEIRQKKLYDRTVVEKNKIDNHMFEYKSYEQ